MSDEERRKRERERKARRRRELREAPKLSLVADLDEIRGTKSGTPGGTEGGTSEPDSESADEPISGLPATNLAAVRAAIALLEVPTSAQYLATQAITCARGLDSPGAIPWGQLRRGLNEAMRALEEASKPREADELDKLRRDFYLGRAGDGDSNPPASTPRRRKASGEA
jgi:hypothetical protein